MNTHIDSRPWQKALLLWIFLFPALAYAQVATIYNFSQTTGTYTPITGGTVLGNASTDDQRFVDPAVPLGGTTLTGVGLPIGFNFTYNGQVYDRFAINANGWISLGNSSNTPAVDITSTGGTSPNYQGIMSATNVLTPSWLRARIAGLASDLQGQTGSELRFETIGTTPNQVLVIQWAGYRRYTQTGHDLNFQIMLYESDNRVEVHYGPMTWNATSNNAQIGLGGFAATDFNNRTTTTNWNSTSAGTTNLDNCLFSTAVTVPVNGTIFRWELASCLPPSGLGATNLTATSADLTWTPSGTGTSWDVQYGPAGFSLGGGVTITGISGQPYTLGSLTPATSYDYYVREVCGGSPSAWAGPFNFNTTCASMLSGTYTINSAVATGGTNFQSFNDALNALMFCGINGPVLMNVLAGSGPYTEQLIISPIPGASAVNTVTFNGNGETLQFSPSVNDQRAVVKLDGADRITFANLVINSTGGTYGYAFQFMNDADYNTITNCTINGDLTNTSLNYGGIVFSASHTSASTNGQTGSFNTISGNTIIGGYYGIAINGSTTSTNGAVDNIVFNNTIRDFYSYGIWLDEANGTLISQNDIHRTNRTVISSFYGVYVSSGTTGAGTRNSLIERNRIHDSHTANTSSTAVAYGITFFANTIPNGSENVIRNNAIYNFNSASGTQYGIYSSGNNLLQIYHNSIAFDNAPSTSGTTYGIYTTGGTAGSNVFDIRNNIVSITRGGTGTKRCLYYATTTATITSNFNVLYMGSTGGTTNQTGMYGSTGYVTLANWQATGFDAGSNGDDPQFANSSIGDLEPSSPGANNIGAPGLAPDDILGNARPATPDPGAWEFSLGACAPPSSLGAGSITGTQADLSWQSNGTGSSWEIEYGPTGFTQGTGTTVTAGSNPYTLTGLSPLTGYDWYVREICAGPTFSGWAGPASFTTGCASTMSGVYTINSAVATGGTNFQTWADAVAELLLCGVSGPVTINVVAASGPYNEQVILTPIPGASAVNTITFNGNGETLAFASANNNERAVIKLNDADYITIENLTINADGGTYGYGMHFIGGADFNTVQNCSIVSSVTSTSSNFAGIVMSGSHTSAITNGNSGSNNLFSGNTIIGGYYGMTMMGISTTGGGCDNNQVLNNNFLEYYIYGMDIDENDGTIIRGNEFSRPTRTSITSFYGIYVEGGVSKRITVERNSIHDSHTGLLTSTTLAYGVYFSGNTTAAGEENKIFNNLIYNFNSVSGTQYGIWSAGNNNLQIYHNTIVLDRATSTGGTTAGIYISGGTTGSITFDVRNNVVSITRGGTGTKRCLWYANTNSVITSDYNVLFMGSTGGTQNYTGTWGSTNYNTLANWQTANSAAYDQNSWNDDPAFVDAANGDLTPTAPAFNDGAVSGLVTVDYYGTSRPATPDPGAVEFNPPACPVPTFQSASVTGTSVDLSWTSNGSGSQWQVEYGPTGFTQGTGTTVTANSNPYTLGGLTPQTVYDWYVRENCGGGNYSNWTGPHTFTSGCLAFLSGVYTINSAVATGGTNYQSFTEAVNDLVICGINAPVTMNVVGGSGPYNEQLVITAIPGASAVNTVTFNGNGETLAFSSNDNNQRAVVKLDGADYITFTNMTVDATGAGTYGWVFHLTNNADFNTISNCSTITAISTTSLNYSNIVISGSNTSATTNGDNGSNNTITGNTIIGGYYGVSLIGNTSGAGAVNNIVSNNTIMDFNIYGVYLDECASPVISQNDLSRANAATTSTFYGIYLAAGTTNNALIEKNRIHNTHDAATSTTSAAYGIYITGVDATAGNENIFRNNALYNFNSGSGSIYGIYNSSSDGNFIYHNSLSFDHAASTGGLVYGIYQITLASNINIRNNVISISRGGTGTKYCLYFSTSTTTFVSDYNVLYNGSTAGTNGIGYRTSGHTTLAAWQAATSQDANSSDVDPLFVSSVGGNLMPQASAINDMALSGLATDDILGVARPATPDPGAWEFSPATCLSPSAQTATSITQNSASLGWTSNSGGTSWNIEYGPTGFTPGTGTTVTTGSNPYALSGLTGSTTYDWYIREDCGINGLSVWAGPHSFTTLCTPPIISSFPWTENFDASTLPTLPCGWNVVDVNGDGGNNMWHTYSSATYSNSGLISVRLYYHISNAHNDWFMTPAVQMTGGTAYQIEFYYRAWSGTYTERMSLYVGTGNGVVDMTTQLWDDPGFNHTTHQLVTVFFTPTVTGTYHFGWYGYSVSNQFGILVDDVTIDLAPVCLPPTVQTATGISGTSAQLGWTAGGGGSSWQIEYGPVGFTQGTGTTVTTGSNPYTLGGLSPSTSYSWYVREDCGINGFSTWVGPHTFTTGCLTFTAPYVENFDGASWVSGTGFDNTGNVIDACWSRNPAPPPFTQFIWGTRTGATGSSSTGPTTDHSGTGKYLFTEGSYGSNGSVAELISPMVNINPLTTPTLTFYYHMYGSTMGSLFIDVWSSSTSTWTNGVWSVSGQQHTTETAPYTLAVVSLGAFSGSTVQVRFRAVRGTDFYNDLAIDEVVIDNAQCYAPTLQNVTGLAHNSATLNWTANGYGSSWIIEYGPAGFTQGTGTTVTHGSTSYNLTGLTQLTGYDWYVREDCGGGNFSNWTGPHSFTTPCLPPVISTFPYTENFDAVTAPAMPCGWDVIDVNADGGLRMWQTFANGSYANSGLNSVRLYYNSSLPHNDWFFTPAIQMTVGTTYTLDFYFRAYSGSYTERMAVYVGNDNTIGAMTTLLWNNTSINNTAYQLVQVLFTPTSSGTYHFGWWGYSLSNQFGINVDDVTIDICQPGIWTGLVSTNWFDAGNWCGGSIPAPGTNVIVPTTPSGGQFPVIPVFGGIPATAANVTLQNGATLTIQNGGTLEFTGTLNLVGGARNLGEGTLRYAGSAANTVNNTLTIGTLHVNGSGLALAAGANVTVIDALNLQSGVLTVPTTGKLTLKSSSAKTAYVRDFGGWSGSVSGSVNVERHVDHYQAGQSLAFHYLSAPVSGLGIFDFADDFPVSGANGAQYIPDGACLEGDPSTPYGSMWEYIESAPNVGTCNLYGWHIKTAGSFPAGQGFAAIMVHNSILDLEGPLHTGNYPVSGLTNSGAGLQYGFNLVGNPYASAIEWTSQSGFDAAAYIWEATGTYAGTYQPVLSGTGSYIGSGQGFFIRVSNPGTQTFTFSNSMRHASSGSFYRTGSWYDRMLDIHVEGNGFADKSIVYFKDGASVDFDTQFDALKLPGNPGQPMLSTEYDGYRMSINGQPSVGHDKEIPLNFRPGADGSFTMMFNSLESFPSTAMVFLEDKLTGTFQNLMINNVYTFNSVTSDQEDRFVLHFYPALEFTGTEGTCEQPLGALTINDMEVEGWVFNVVDETGAVLVNNQDLTSVFELNNLPAGVYTVELTHNSGYVTVETIEIAEIPVVATAIAVDKFSVEVDEPVLFSGSATNATDYLWSMGDGNMVNNLQDVMYTFAQPGVYVVSLQASNEICSDIASIEITVLPKTEVGLSGMPDAPSLQVWGYESNLFIRTANLSSPEITILISDVTGRLVYSNQMAVAGNLTVLNPGILQSGIYMVKVINVEQSAETKMFMYRD